MKKAVINTGGKQYVVAEGETIEVEKLSEKGKSVSFAALLVIDGDKTIVGTPEVKDIKVVADIVSPEVKADKVTSIRYKSKKRVKKVHGHRQVMTSIKITKIG